MFVYFAILSLLIYLIVKYDIQGYTNWKEAWINIFMVLLILLAGLRYHIGTDTVHYESWFENAPELSDIFRDADLWSEPLWTLLLSLVKTTTDSYIVFQFVVAIIFNTLLFRFLKSTTDKIFTVLFFVFCVSWWVLSFEVLRESICVVLYLNALLYLKERKILHYVIIGIIMMGFHKFSFVMMLITPLVVFVKEKITLPIVILITVLLFFSDSVIELIDLISIRYLDDESVSRIGAYLYNSEHEGAIQTNIWGYLRALLLSFALPIITIAYNQTNDNMKFFNRVLILILLFSTLQTKLIIFYRLLNYLNILFIICFVNVLYNSRISQPIIKTGLYMLVSLYLYFGTQNFYRPSHIEYRSGINYNCVYIPYKTVFEEPDPTREALLN